MTTVITLALAYLETCMRPIAVLVDRTMSSNSDDDIYDHIMEWLVHTEVLD